MFHGGPRSIRTRHDDWEMTRGDVMATAVRAVNETDSGGSGIARALSVRVTVQAGQVWEADVDAAAL